MSTLIGPDFIALQVRDLDASRRFYTAVVGLVAADGGPPDAVVFDTRPVAFAVRKPLVDLAAAGGRPGWGVSVWMACDDADGLHARLAGAGVEVVAPPADGPFGRFFVFRDPDGYALTAHQAAPPRTGR